MVDKDRFLQKLNENTEAKLSEDKEKDAQLKEKIDNAKKVVDLYLSSIENLIKSITNWVSGTPFEINIFDKKLSDTTRGINTPLFYTAKYFSLTLGNINITFDPLGCLKYPHNGLIDIDVNDLKLVKAYDNIFLLLDSNGNGKWYFSDNRKKYPVDGDSFRSFLLKTLNIE
ncbi:hypothetical protein L1R45_00980 [Klebsiella pneumoniae]|uniref:hypothetical protein n=1 Tax=Klebsiella pneumoniae complex TaxID=3390273 RepID=UPI000E2AD47D|nr:MULTISPECIES: hypothetical protein [Klebsiella]DAG11086.1 MAG TPA: hypothetical protein [Caudoviricetes sp.]MBP0694212.1 hypothetical protein [Klebsiella pneumoniae]MBW3320095.1 hypothetical protein [Klebsiella pneumoniae]MCY3479901.1 hypothetical protein [Klebsiella pneumoniae]MXR92043.1 hypothetical protein [Klebsiella pneumoniae]